MNCCRENDSHCHSGDIGINCHHQCNYGNHLHHHHHQRGRNDEVHSHYCRQSHRHNDRRRRRQHSMTSSVMSSLLLMVAFVVAQSEECTCMLSHPQEHYCSADFVALVQVRKKANSDPTVASYHVKVRKEFKMTEETKKILSHGLIWTTSSESMCGKKFEPNTRYLITGNINGKKAWVSMCNYVERWSTLTNKQKRGFRRLYGLGCKCKVRETPRPSYFSYKHVNSYGKPTHGRHRLAASTGSCNWDTKWDRSTGHGDCQSLYTVCVPASEAVRVRSLYSNKGDDQLGNHLNNYRSENDDEHGHRHHQQCQWIHNQAYRACMKVRRMDKERSSEIERQEKPTKFIDRL